MTTFLAGVDEIATERQLSEGWTYCVLPLASATALAAEAPGLAAAGKPLVFHGTSFKWARRSQYAAFLRLIRSTAEGASTSLLEFTLMDETWKHQFVPFIERAVTGGLTAAAVHDRPVHAALARALPGLATLQGYIAHLGSDSSVRVDLDRDNVTKVLPTLTVIRGGRTIPAINLLSAAYNAHRQVVFPNSPRIERGGIRILRDSASVLVQAADVVGNFAMSYLLRALGHASRKIGMKAQIFEDVFHDVLPDDPLAAMASLVNNDIVLATAGRLRLTLWKDAV